MRAVSIRWRLTGWYVLALSAALALFCGLLWLSLRHTLLNDLDESLASAADRFQVFFIREAAETPPARLPAQLKDELGEFSQALPATEYVELLGANGFEFHYSETVQPLTRSRTLRRQFAVGSDTYTLRIVASLQPIDHTLELVGWLLFALTPVVIAIASVGGAWLGRRALRPVDEISSAARDIGIGNLSTRLPVPQTGDELQRLAEVWNTMLARIEAAVNTLSQFSADASHELRTPLAIIRTSVEIALRRERSPESYRVSLAEIYAETERMTRLVEDLLFLARNESHTFPMEPLDVGQIVLKVTEEMRQMAVARGVTLRCDLPSEAAPVTVLGNSTALRRLFLVLLDNAVKYSPAGSEVRLQLSPTGDHAVVAIQDSGAGIDPADLSHIFKRFYQADKSRHDSGFGLGLSLADSIARAHTATIEVESSPGAGSTFRVAFRREPSAPPTVTTMDSGASILSESAK
jgi:signal transduction histidine kinase